MNPTDPIRCPECGKPVPAASQHQVCPACLLRQALASRTLVTDPLPAAMAPPPAPEDIAAHFPQFELTECLGRGGMGVVYKARQKSLDRWVAIKILPPERVGEEKFAERFAREAATLAKLSHPNIVTIHDFGETNGLFYIVMEYVDGVNLRDLLRDGKLDPRQALAIVPPICEALQYAHDKGIVHRDIKPENLLLDRDGRIKIADFGIAGLIGAGGERIGTPPYMAPEQAGAERQIDHRADIYALGVVLYEMLTGERPAKDLITPSKKVQIDVRLDEMVLRALEKNPELRYQTAGEFRTVVETMMAPPPPLAAATVVETPPASVRAPAIAMMMVSGIGMFGGFIALANGLAMYLGILYYRHADLPVGFPPASAMILLFLMQLVSLVAYGIAIFGGLRMYQLRSRWWGICGTTILLFSVWRDYPFGIGQGNVAGPGWSLFAALVLLRLGVGVWVLVVLMMPGAIARFAMAASTPAPASPPPAMDAVDARKRGGEANAAAIPSSEAMMGGSPPRGMFRRWWWILLVMIPVGMLLGLGAGGIWSHVVPKKFETFVIFEARREPGEPVRIPWGPGGILAEFKSAETLARLESRLQLGKRWAMPTEDAIRALGAIITVDTRRGTDLIELNVRCTDPEECREIANEAPKAYLPASGVRVIVLNEARLPQTPVSPKVPLIFTVSTLSGIPLGLLLALPLMALLQRLLPERAAAADDPAIPAPHTVANPESPDRRRQAILRYGMIVCATGLPIGLALKLPVVWILSLVGLLVGGYKLRCRRASAPLGSPPLRNAASPIEQAPQLGKPSNIPTLRPSLWPTVVLHAVLSAGVTTLFVLVIPRFATLFREWDMQLPTITRLVMTPPPNWVILGLPILLGMDAGCCWLARHLGGRRGLFWWTIGVIAGLALMVVVVGAALMIPLQKMVTELNPDATQTRAQIEQEPKATRDSLDGLARPVTPQLLQTPSPTHIIRLVGQAGEKLAVKNSAALKPTPPAAEKDPATLEQ